jgi:hypothetical protein
MSREVYGVDQHASGEISQKSFRLVLPSLGIRGEL